MTTITTKQHEPAFAIGGPRVIPFNGRFYINMGYPGFNSPTNNAFGYATAAQALAASRRYEHPTSAKGTTMTKDKPFVSRTSPKAHRTISDVMLKLSRGLSSLAYRWADESQYEDFADYERVMRGWLPAGFHMLKATRRPFGFTFTFDEAPKGSEYRIKVMPKFVTWYRVK